MHRVPPLFTFNTNGTKVEVVPTPNIYIRDPFSRIKRKKGLIAYPKEGRKETASSQAAEAEEIDEEEEILLGRR